MLVLTALLQRAGEGGKPLIKGKGLSCDGGLPCVPCPADIKNYLPKPFKGNVSVANEFCGEDSKLCDAWKDTAASHTHSAPLVQTDTCHL